MVSPVSGVFQNDFINKITDIHFFHGWHQTWKIDNLLKDCPKTTCPTGSVGIDLGLKHDLNTVPPSQMAINDKSSKRKNGQKNQQLLKKPKTNSVLRQFMLRLKTQGKT